MKNNYNVTPFIGNSSIIVYDKHTSCGKRLKQLFIFSDYRWTNSLNEEQYNMCWWV